MSAQAFQHLFRERQERYCRHGQSAIHFADPAL